MQDLQHGKPAEAHAIVSSVESCVDDVRSWCASKRLQLNASNTEVLWFGTAAQLRKVPKCDRTVRIGGSAVEPISVVRDLGVYVDTELTMQEHVSRTARACFFHIRRLRTVRRSSVVIGDRPTCVNVNTVASRLLQCSPRWSTCYDLGTVATCAKRRCSSCSRARAIRSESHVTSLPSAC
jgi:hypothetical protein